MGGGGRLIGDEDLVTRLSKAGVTRGDLVGLAVTADGTAGSGAVNVVVPASFNFIAENSFWS